MTDEDIPLCVDRALCMAAWEGDTETVRALLDAGADVHAWADAPLWDAAMNGHAEIMRVLLDSGADQDIALVEAAANGLVELVRELLGKGVSVHAYRDMPLMMADHNRHTETVKVLKNWKRRRKTKRTSGSQMA
jgi:Ankyrin repeats (3 copies)